MLWFSHGETERLKSRDWSIRRLKVPL